MCAPCALTAHISLVSCNGFAGETWNGSSSFFFLLLLLQLNRIDCVNRAAPNNRWDFVVRIVCVWETGFGTIYCSTGLSISICDARSSPLLSNDSTTSRCAASLFSNESDVQLKHRAQQRIDFDSFLSKRFLFTIHMFMSLKSTVQLDTFGSHSEIFKWIFLFWLSILWDSVIRSATIWIFINDDVCLTHTLNQENC